MCEFKNIQTKPSSSHSEVGLEQTRVSDCKNTQILQFYGCSCSSRKNEPEHVVTTINLQCVGVRRCRRGWRCLHKGVLQCSKQGRHNKITSFTHQWKPANLGNVEKNIRPRHPLHHRLPAIFGGNHWINTKKMPKNWFWMKLQEEPAPFLAICPAQSASQCLQNISTTSGEGTRDKPTHSQTIWNQGEHELNVQICAMLVQKKKNIPISGQMF